MQLLKELNEAYLMNDILKKIKYVTMLYLNKDWETLKELEQNQLFLSQFRDKLKKEYDTYKRADQHGVIDTFFKLFTDDFIEKLQSADIV